MIFHTRRRKDHSVFDAQLVAHQFGTHQVEVISLRQIGSRTSFLSRNRFRGHKECFALELSLFQHVLTARLIFLPFHALLPPGIVTAVLRTPVFEHHAGFMNRLVVPRLNRRTVVTQLSQSGGIGIISQPFIGPRIIHPRRIKATRRKRLGRHFSSAAQHMGGRSGPLGFIIRPKMAAPVPEGGAGMT